MSNNSETISHCWMKFPVCFYENEQVDYLMSYYGSDYVFLFQLLFCEAVKENKEKIDITCINANIIKYYNITFIKEALKIYEDLMITNIKNNSIIQKFKSCVYRKRNSPEYNEWRNSVFQRDNYTCKMCGTKGGKLNAHHIELWSKNDDLRFSVDNGITLCVDCHKKLHKNGGYNYAEKND